MQVQAPGQGDQLMSQGHKEAVLPEAMDERFTIVEMGGLEASWVAGRS